MKITLNAWEMTALEIALEKTLDTTNLINKECGKKLLQKLLNAEVIGIVLRK